MKRAYITRAILKDYLTIKNVDITFKDGINIIIGKNGTGKTNFINYLDDSLSRAPKIPNNNSSIYFCFFEDIYSKEIRNVKLLKNLDDRIYQGSERILPKQIKHVNLRDNKGNILEDINILEYVDALKIAHGLPNTYRITQTPINDIIRKIPEGYSVFPNTEGSFGLLIGAYYVTQFSKEEFNIDDAFKLLNENLLRYSNIERIRIGQNFRLNDSDKNEIHFNNLYIEYSVNGEWLTFDQLSDGTKRIFYIISEITLNSRPVVLLEEPELGIHPHQLYDLMRFIREMSEKFQFIITTHSPMVLNSVNSDELDNIIISKIENGETRLEHLSEEQKEKAKLYMQDLDLSDYWIHSDLED